MRVGIIGGGVSGLAAATYLLDHARFDVTILERDDTLGGRANVLDGAEHCQRLFISNYDEMFALLDRIPHDGRSLLSTLQPVTRMVNSDGLWKAIDHMYAIWARDLRFIEKYRVIRTRQQSALLADRGPARKKALRIIVNLRPQELLSVLMTSKAARKLWCLSGPTDACLITPWAEFLVGRGVELRTSASVMRMRQDSGSSAWTLTFGDGYEDTFDAIISTAMPHDLAAILDVSAVPHRLPRMQNNLHFKAATFRYDSFTPAGLGLPPYALMAHNGVTVFLQRSAGRAVCFFTSPMDPTDAEIVDRAREMIEPFGALHLVGIRDNAQPHEAIYSSRTVDSARAVRAASGLYVSGSTVRTGYPGDSGEAAVLAARMAVKSLVADQWLSQRCTG